MDPEDEKKKRIRDQGAVFERHRILALIEVHLKARLQYCELTSTIYRDIVDHLVHLIESGFTIGAKN